MSRCGRGSVAEIARIDFTRLESGAKATALQTLRECRTSTSRAKRLECVRLQRRFSLGPHAFDLRNTSFEPIAARKDDNLID